MLKKILIGLLLLIVVLAGLMFYLDHRNRTLSPPDEQRITTENGLTVRISYSRPSVRGRVIFGDEADGALQPYGKYWRLGANEATVIEFNRDVSIAGTRIPKGSYGMYALPGKDEFVIGINDAWNRWGVSEPDYSGDLLQVRSKVESSDFVEQFTIELGETDQGVKVIFHWDTLRFVLPITDDQSDAI